MRPPQKPASRTRALIGLILIVAALLFVLALIEGPDSKLGCTPIAPASANTVEATSLEPSGTVLADPGQHAESQSPTHSAVALEQMLRGRVVDEETNEPVPWVSVQIKAGTTNLHVLTKDDGSFVADVPTEAGEITAEVTDDGETVGAARTVWPLPGDASAWEIRVPIGPTFPVAGIDNDTLTEKSAWRMRLVESEYPRGSAGVILVSFDKLAPLGKGTQRDWGWKALRFEGGLPFVRWPRPMFPSSHQWFPSMLARSERASAKASVPVFGTVGIQRPLAVRTQGFAVLSGHVSVSGESTSGGTHVVVCDPIEDDKTTFDSVPFFSEVETKDDSSYSFEVPALRTYRLDAWHAGMTTAEELATVRQGKSTAPDLRLSAPEKRKISRAPLVVNFDSRSDRAGSILRLSPSKVATFTDAILFDAERQEFDLSNLAVGPYRVENIGIDERTHLSTLRRHQMMPARQLDPPPKDTPRACVHRIDARAPGTIERCLLAAGPAGSVFTTSKQESTFVWTLPPDNSAVFTVWCTGCSPALITEERFEKNDEGLVAVTTLSPGWGALLAFRAGDPDDVTQQRGKLLARSKLSATDAYGFTVPPLPGVGVEYAGARLGSSDRDGCVLVSQMLQPERLTLVAPGWHMTGMSRMPGAGSRWWVWMKRDE